MVPLLSLSDHSCFLWEKVSLLVEYEPLKTPLFPQEAGTADLAVLQRLQLQQYVALRSVLELSASSVSFSLGENINDQVEVSVNFVCWDRQQQSELYSCGIRKRHQQLSTPTTS